MDTKKGAGAEKMHPRQRIVDLLTQDISRVKTTNPDETQTMEYTLTMLEAGDDYYGGYGGVLNLEHLLADTVDVDMGAWTEATQEYLNNLYVDNARTWRRGELYDLALSVHEHRRMDNQLLRGIDDRRWQDRLEDSFVQSTYNAIAAYEKAVADMEAIGQSPTEKESLNERNRLDYLWKACPYRAGSDHPINPKFVRNGMLPEALRQLARIQPRLSPKTPFELLQIGFQAGMNEEELASFLQDNGVSQVGFAAQVAEAQKARGTEGGLLSKARKRLGL